MARSAGWLGLLVGFVLVGTSCRAPDSNANTFLLRTAEPNVVAASDRVADLVFDQLQAGQSFPEGYPMPGRVVAEPDPSDPGVERMSCAAGLPVEAAAPRCIRLGDQDDFIRVQPITWESAAFFMYRIYIAPPSPFVRVSPAKDFVAVDVFVRDGAPLWQGVDRAIRSAVSEMGARPFRP